MFLHKDFKRGDFFFESFKTGDWKRDTGIQLMLIIAFNSNRYLSHNMVIKTRDRLDRSYPSTRTRSRNHYQNQWKNKVP